MQKAFKDTPLVEISLRKYERPEGLEGRELVKKLCLSVGLLQPGDSRDVVVDVLHSLLIARRQHLLLSSEEIKDRVIKLREQSNLPMVGIASSNIRRQLLRLRNIFLVEKVKNNYRINEHATLGEIFNEKIEKFLLPSILARVKEYLSTVDKEFSDMTKG
ncbi:hypothetical protein J4460_01210 [Candidatus Woesearchaeota archaeon]|nr:MAG: hypothetical protein QS99_C0001G0058 [archaeon GW2011_AR4]MBS3129270.1 hypothetical protein [Candidatus Woesearchaeota archaeon]HIH38573.1 hypothetical protein [Candidatus Woesearchaeota archaeon]HIH48528.1 hypothetical protein [Candidatus Woesearchaeota archaeon]HIJ02777.1 hypothetical protein [Candidatus Woesearchaeota archaeon]